MKYVSALAHYGQMGWDEAEERPVVEGLAIIAAGIERDGWLNFAGIKRKGDGYVGQEIQQRLN